MKGRRYISVLLIGPCLDEGEAEELLRRAFGGLRLVRLEGPLAIVSIRKEEKEEAISRLNVPALRNGIPYILRTYRTSGTIRKALEVGKRGLYAYRELFILHFLHIIGRLKGMRRSGWVIRGIRDAETVAEHSHRASLLAFFLFGWEGAVSMILHDLHESIIGDLLPWEEGKGEREEEGWRRLFCMISHLFPELGQYWSLQREFRDADILELQLQAVEYEATRGLDPTEFLADEVAWRPSRRLKEAILRYREDLKRLYGQPL